jgi:hypothetical protein
MIGWKIAFTLTLFMALTSFAFYTSAQFRTNEDQDFGRTLDSGASEDTGIAGGMRPPKAGESILIQSVTRDGETIDFYESIHFPSPSFMVGRKLRIEMQDGTIQEYELLKVKRVTVEPNGSLRYLRNAG